MTIRIRICESEIRDAVMVLLKNKLNTEVLPFKKCDLSLYREYEGKGIEEYIEGEVTDPYWFSVRIEDKTSEG